MKDLNKAANFAKSTVKIGAIVGIGYAGLFNSAYSPGGRLADERMARHLGISMEELKERQAQIDAGTYQFNNLKKDNSLEIRGELYEEIRNHIWQDFTVKHGIYEDTKGDRRYTELGFTLPHLKLMGLIVKDKPSGAMIWSEKAKVHEALGVSYDEYAKNHKEYAADARNAFIDDAQFHIKSLNNLHLQKIWNNVVQAEGVDQYLDAEGYVIDGKEYVMDGITILALSRFHSVKETKEFLESRDRANPVLSESMAATIKRFNGMEHELNLDLLPIRTFVGEGGDIFRKKDFRVAHALPEYNENDYMVMLETKAFRESSYDLKAGKGAYTGYYQINKKYLLGYDVKVEKDGKMVTKHVKGYLDKYNDAHGTKFTKKDFDKKQWLQTAIIKDYHANTALYAGAAGLAEFLPYISNRNIVELEYVNPIKEVERNFIQSPEQLEGAKQVQAGDGKLEFGFQVGATYRLRNGRLAKVVDVGTRSRQNHPLGFLSQSHLGGAGNVDKSFSKQMRYNQQDFEDANGTPITDYFFMTDHVINERTLQDAIDNSEFEVPMKGGRLKKEYRTSEVLKPMEKYIAPIRSVKGRPVFDEAKYKQKFAEKAKGNRTASVEIEGDQAPQASWHSRVGQVSSKERRQHGTS